MRWRLLLYPLSLLYAFVVFVRRWAYRKGLFSSKKYPVKTIGVGNLRVGGTGKTPHVEFLIKEMSQQYKVAVLSRGYGRKSNGVILASEHAVVTSQLIGDEPMQYFTKFPLIDVIVAEKRCEGMEYLMKKNPEISCVILDDCFQHLQIQCDEYWLITEFERLYCNDFPFPAGNLREGRRAAKYADTIIVSKSPLDIIESQKQEIATLLKVEPVQQLLFSSIKYGELCSVFPKQQPLLEPNNTTVILLSGIANPKPLFAHLALIYPKVIPCYYPDHYNYKPQDMDSLLALYSQYLHNNTIIITTEKDAMRLQAFNEHPVSELPFYYLPIEVFFSSPS